MGADGAGTGVTGTGCQAGELWTEVRGRKGEAGRGWYRAVRGRYGAADTGSKAGEGAWG